MARRHPCRQVGEKRRDLGGDRRLRVGAADPVEILFAGLLNNGEAPA